MGSPTYPGYGGGVPYTAHPLGNEQIYNTGRYNDDYACVEDRFPTLNVNDNRPARPQSIRTTTSGSTSQGKQYAYYRLTRTGRDWSQAESTEIAASQSDIEKCVKKSKSSALELLKKMTPARRETIDRLADELSSQEPSVHSWEPVHIEPHRLSRDSSGKTRIKSFDVILARRMSYVGSDKRRRSSQEEKVIFKDDASRMRRDSVQKSNQKVYRSSRGSIDPQDVFGTTRLFDDKGVPMNSRGHIPFDNAGLPDHIKPERPIARAAPNTGKLPNRLPSKESLPNEQVILDDGDDIDLDKLLPPKGGRNNNNNNDNRSQIPHRVSQPAQIYQQPRQDPTQRFSHGHIEIEDRSPDPWHGSTRSSWTSDGASAIFGEVDEASSRTSEDTHNSYNRSPARKSRTIYNNDPHVISRTRTNLEVDQYRTDDDHRRRSSVAELKHIKTGSRNEQYLVRRQSAPKPVIHQQGARRQSQPQSPTYLPTAEYPQYYQDQDAAQRAEDYMRDTIRETDYQQRKQEVDQREHDIRFQERTNQFASGRNGRGGRYNYYPRDDL